MRSVKAVALAGALVMGLALSACSSSTASAPSGSAASREFSFGYVPGGPTDAAKLGGYLDKLSAKINLVQINSGSEALKLMSGGSLQGVGQTGLVPIIIAASQGVKFKIVWVDDTVPTSLVAKSGITSVKDLKGKRVSAPAGSLMEFQLTKELEDAGMSRSDVEFVNLPAPQAAAALKTGGIDAVVTFQPFTTDLVGKGFKDLKDLDSMDLTYFGNDFVNNDGATIQSYLCAMDAAGKSFSSDPEGTWTKLAKSVDMSVDTLKAAFPKDTAMLTASGVNGMLSGDNSKVAQQIVSLSKLMADAGTISQPLTAEQAKSLIDSAFVSSAAEGKCS